MTGKTAYFGTRSIYIFHKIDQSNFLESILEVMRIYWNAAGHLSACTQEATK